MGFFKTGNKPKKKSNFFSMEREQEKDKTFEMDNNKSDKDELSKQFEEDNKKAKKYT